jgi:hypothetical protein
MRAPYSSSMRAHDRQPSRGLANGSPDRFSRRRKQNHANFWSSCIRRIPLLTTHYPSLLLCQRTLFRLTAEPGTLSRSGGAQARHCETPFSLGRLASGFQCYCPISDCLLPLLQVLYTIGKPLPLVLRRRPVPTGDGLSQLAVPSSPYSGNIAARATRPYLVGWRPY